MNGSTVSASVISSVPGVEGRAAAKAARTATSATLTNSDGCAVTPAEREPALRSELRHAEREDGPESADGDQVAGAGQRRRQELPVVEAGHRQERDEGGRRHDRLAGAAVVPRRRRQHAEGEQRRHRAGEPEVQAPAEPGYHGASPDEASSDEACTRRSETAYASRISRATGAAFREPMPCSR